MPGRPKGLPRLTPPAWKLIFVTCGLLGAAVNTGNNLIYLLFSLLVASFPISLGVSRLNLRRLRLELQLPSAPERQGHQPDAEQGRCAAPVGPRRARAGDQRERSHGDDKQAAHAGVR